MDFDTGARTAQGAAFMRPPRALPARRAPPMLSPVHGWRPIRVTRGPPALSMCGPADAAPPATGRSPGGVLRRRAALARVLLVAQQLWSFGPAAAPRRECWAADAQRPARGAAALPFTVSAGSAPARKLLQTIPVMPFGAPATNATVEPALARDIEQQAAALEQGTRGLATSDQLSDSWRLLYSNGREIRNLASGLPLGFALGRVYQPVDTAGGRFENQGFVEHMWGLARGSNSVVGDVRVAPLGTVNAAGTENAAGNRVDVDFRRILFSIDEILGRRVSLRKVIITTQDPAAAQPANDITYLDETLRITRGGDDSLFIFRREASPRAMLSAAERQALFAEGGSEAVLFGSTDSAGANDAKRAAPELRKLIDE